MIHIPLVAGNAVVEQHRLIREHELDGIISILSHRITSRYAASATAVVPTAPAGEYRLSAVYRDCGDRASGESVVKSIDFSDLTSAESGSLHILRSLSTSVEQFLTERGNRVVLRVEFERAELVENSLRASCLRVDNVAGVVGIGESSGVALVLHDVLRLAGREAVITAKLLSYKFFILYLLWFPISSDYIFISKKRAGHSCRDYWYPSSLVSR